MMVLISPVSNYVQQQTQRDDGYNMLTEKMIIGQLIRLFQPCVPLEYILNS